MTLPRHLALAAAVVLIGFAAASSDESAADAGATYTERHLASARTHRDAGRSEEARAEFLKVLERDGGNFHALEGLVSLAVEAGEEDETVYYMYRFVDRASKLRDLDAPHRKRLKEYKLLLKEKDPNHGKLGSYRAAHLRRLLNLGAAHMKKGRYHSAKAIFEEVLHIAPSNAEARAALRRIRTDAGNELAEERPAGTEDLFSDVTREWIEKQDARHSTWDTAWEKKLDNYTIFTDAGYEVLEIIALALEQLDTFFRIFYDYKTDGSGTPHIQIKIYKDRAEFMRLGKPHVDWAAGFYNGSAVVTYDPRGSRAAGDGRSEMEPSRSLKGLIQTLAHEVSHHFVSIAPGSGVPAWMNEGFASFFEGTRLLSNGRIEWNIVAPHRLRPLVEYLQSEKPPDLARIISCRVDDYRIFYPYGWGLVYFLWNYEDEEGNYLYRNVLREYRALYVGGVDHLERFTKFIIERPDVPGISNLQEFEEVFTGYILKVNEEYLGRTEVARQYEERADEFMENENVEKALLFYEKALAKRPEDPGLLWKLARVLEALGENDRAAGTYRTFLTRAEFHGITDDPRLAAAREKIEKLDPIAGRFRKIREQFESDILFVARTYRDLGLFLMALQTARELAVADNPSIPARDFYLDVEKESGKTLEQWQVAFNETDLSGWYGEDIVDEFRVEDDRLVGEVEEGDVPDQGKATQTGSDMGEKPTIPYKIFLLDREIQGDFSFDTEVRAPEACELYGICFGARTKDAFQSVLLKSDQNLDFSTFDGGWTILRHIPVMFDPAEWNRLRVDVRGRLVSIRMNGELVEELEFESGAELRGDVGILVGKGLAEYRNIRFLERNWRLPSRRIKRTFESRYSPDALPERAGPGQLSYRGKFPPPLTIGAWRNTAPLTLDKLIGKVVVLAFWSQDQESSLPTLPVYQKLLEEYGYTDVELLVVANEKEYVVDAFLAECGLPLKMAVDRRDHRTIIDYGIPDTGLPRFLLIDLNGKVVWDGNPDWSKKYGSYLDKPLADLVKSLRLRDIARLRARFPEAKQALSEGRFKEALDVYGGFQGMSPAHADVRFAQGELERIRRASRDLLGLAQQRREKGNYLGALDLLEKLAAQFQGSPFAGDPDSEIRKLKKEPLFEDARWIEFRAVSAMEALGKGGTGKFADLLKRIGDRLERLSTAGKGGLREIEFALIRSWLATGQKNPAGFAGRLAAHREIRISLETIEEMAAGTRLFEARRLLAELVARAQGTPYQEIVDRLLDRL